MNKRKLRKLIQGFRAEKSKILKSLFDANGVLRDMTPEECKRVDDLEEKVDKHEEMLNRMDDEPDASADVDGADSDTSTGADDRSGNRSQDNPQGRSSNPNQFNGQSPAIHTREHRYSIMKALRSAVDGKQVTGMEWEVTQEVRKYARNKVHKGAFTMPIDPSPEMRALMYPRYHERTDLTTTSGTGGIFTVPEMPMIDLLRSRLVIYRMGCTLLTGMQGLFAIPRQSGKSTVNWIAEGSSATQSTPTLDQVPFSPKLAVDAVNISRQFINQTSVSSETFVLNDLGKSLAVEWDRVTINGLGSGSNQPLGILQNSTIQTNSAALAIGPSGGLPTWATAVNLESTIANLNADSGKLAYLTNPTVRSTWKQTPKGTASTFPLFIWEDGAAPGEGKVNGSPAYATTNVPNNLTKGSGSGLSAIMYGNWEDLVIASWDDGIDFLINPYSNQLSAAVLISMEMSVDSEVRHPESFAIVTDAYHL